jgi:lysophospholipase
MHIKLSPLEFGSWDPDLSAMTNMTYVGTHLTNGQPPNDTGCVTGFDEVGFIIGTSASLFNVRDIILTSTTFTETE